MDIPIRMDGRETGRLEITNEGMYTVFSARCEDPGRLIRLAVYGEGGEGVLGVMMPEDGVLTLRKRLSRASLRGFPDVLRYAAPYGEGEKTGKRETAETEAACSPEPERPAAQRREETAAGSAERDGTGEKMPDGGENGHGDESKPPSAGAGTELLWYEAGDGSLYTVWEGRRFRAIPMTAYGLPEKLILERRVIEGIEYAVFEFGEGRVI